jgi:hypothetical protein
MPRDGAIMFSDLSGKFDPLRVACDSADAVIESPKATATTWLVTGRFDRTTLMAGS